MPKNFTKHFGKLVKVVKFREILSHLGFNGSIGWHILLDPYFQLQHTNASEIFFNWSCCHQLAQYTSSFCCFQLSVPYIIIIHDRNLSLDKKYSYMGVNVIMLFGEKCKNPDFLLDRNNNIIRVQQLSTDYFFSLLINFAQISSSQQYFLHF